MTDRTIDQIVGVEPQPGTRILHPLSESVNELRFGQKSEANPLQRCSALPRSKPHENSTCRATNERLKGIGNHESPQK